MTAKPTSGAYRLSEWQEHLLYSSCARHDAEITGELSPHDYKRRGIFDVVNGDVRGLS